MPGDGIDRLPLRNRRGSDWPLGILDFVQNREPHPAFTAHVTAFTIPEMRKFFRKQLTYFLIGFVIAFVIYLFVRYNADAILLGVVIGAGGGLGVCAVMAYLSRRFPDDDPPKVPPART